ncbi:tyrosine-type recombinase/integrase [Jiulongibacter sediminis]|uniref:Tyr recombinase domain-containing protein n=1 Tax=Jiulongibacter sediminis TaxID=1605367 RepID=A0A0P7BRQ2_9BACT|nr:site-specific integrase [Jiulongibacter sediminis]KPM50016.1 hypothetical protein AFM12_05555 [Jiulongibacter sediminis]TBX27044.1 hypothetical protein TK44_05560 [Jiulongibacter sediminis]
MRPVITIVQDRRRQKANGTYPVKLSVFQSKPRIRKLFPIGLEYNEKEFESIWNSSRPKGNHRDQNLKLNAILSKACNIADEMEVFSLETFEKKLFRNSEDGLSVKYHYEIIISELKKREQLGNASNYNLSLKSLKRFLEGRGKKLTIDKLKFLDIDKEFLEDYEFFMIQEGRSLTTVSFYVRALRAVFNRAIEEGEIGKENYPFGKRKYKIPAAKKVKKALSSSDLHKLFHSKPETPEQEKARDFWFFSYMCSGMNIKDIAQIKFKDIKEDRFEFIREKTKRTAKANITPIVVYLNPYAKGIIERYGNEDRSSYVFPILCDGLNAKEQRARVQNFTRFINQHIKKLGKSLDLPDELSTYWARHSMATKALRDGRSLEFIQESLGHENLKTTQNYIAGFENEVKKDFAESLMNF